MNIEQRHFWSLYFDFIEAFKEVAYEQFPFPLFVDFDKYIDISLKEGMGRADFSKFINNKIEAEAEIQQKFEKYMPSHSIKPKVKPTNGKVLIYEKMLRFPDEILLEYFDPSCTSIFRENDSGYYLDIPIVSLSQYVMETRGLTNNLLITAKNLLESHRNHPVFGSHYFRKRFLKEVPIITKRITAIERLFEHNNIACVLVGATHGEGMLLGRMLTTIAAARGIPSICMQHGLIAAGEWMPVYVTKQAIYGKYERELYRKKGVPDEKLEMIGHPQFDRIFTRKPMPKPTFKQKLKLNSDKKTFLIATQPINNVSDWTILIEYLSKYKVIDIVFKLHPIEQRKQEIVDEYKKLTLKYKNVKIIDPDIELYDILPNIDAVAVELSTVGLEAMLFEKPVVFFMKNNKLNYDYLEKMDLFKNNPKEVGKALNQLLTESKENFDENKKIKKFLNYAYPHQLAGIKLTNLIYELSGIQINRLKS